MLRTEVCLSILSFSFTCVSRLNNLKGQPIQNWQHLKKPISKLAEASKWVSWAVYIASTLHMYSTVLSIEH